jgi:hypothetical protein
MAQTLKVERGASPPGYHRSLSLDCVRTPLLRHVTAGYSILFVICAFAYLMAFALNHLCAPKFELVSYQPRNL